MATLKELEQRRAERRAKHDSARDAQLCADLESIDALEAASGAPLRTMMANEFTAGVPVKIAFRSPSPAEYKRYCDMVGRAQQDGDPLERRKAQELLAASCIVYPAPETKELEALFKAAPGTLISVAIECAKAAELRAEAEGKG